MTIRRKPLFFINQSIITIKLNSHILLDSKSYRYSWQAWSNYGCQARTPVRCCKNSKFLIQIKIFHSVLQTLFIRYFGTFVIKINFILIKTKQKINHIISALYIKTKLSFQGYVLNAYPVRNLLSGNVQTMHIHFTMFDLHVLLQIW